MRRQLAAVVTMMAVIGGAYSLSGSAVIQESVSQETRRSSARESSGGTRITGTVRTPGFNLARFGALVFTCQQGVSGLTKYGAQERSGAFDLTLPAESDAVHLIAFHRRDPVANQWRGPSNLARVDHDSTRHIELIVPTNSAVLGEGELTDSLGRFGEVCRAER